MARMEHQDRVDALERELDRSVTLLATADPDAVVPACPDWTVTQLIEHLGVIHRWVTEMVRRRAPARLPREEMTFDRPTGPDDLGRWLGAGGSELVAVLRAAGPTDAMWAWDPDQGVSFWSRRQLHETAMHRIDLAQAMGATAPPEMAELEPAVGDDAVRELLEFLPHVAQFLPGGADLRGDGGTITLRATDFDGIGTITLVAEGFTFTAPDDDADVVVAGSASDLARLLYRRLDPASDSLEIRGRRDVLDHWIEHSALV